MKCLIEVLRITQHLFCSIDEMEINMRKFSNKTIFMMISALLILVFVIFFYWYHIPVKVDKTINMCTLEGNSITVIYNVRWQKYFLKPTDLRGKVTIDSTSYRCISDTNISNTYEGGYAKLKMKITNSKQILPFIKERSNSIYDFNEVIYLTVNNTKLDKVILNLSSNQTNLQYFGPAKTIDDAKYIFESFNVNLK